MRHLIIYTLTALLLLSCEQDTYDKGDGTYSDMTADFVEAHANGEKNIDYVITDNGDSLTLDVPCEASWASTADSTYRAIMYYNKVDANTIKALSISKMNLMSVTPRDSIKTMKTDPIGLESSWISKSKHFITFAITLKVGIANANSEKHRITLIPDSVTLDKSGDKGTLHMTFFHDKGDIPEYYTEKFYFSLPTSILSGFGCDSAAIRVNTTANGNKTLTFPIR